jgi:oxygen-dependent protoporphyrinogen oxidase
LTTTDGKIEASGLVVSVPAFAAAPVIEALSADAARELRAIDHASVAVVTIVYPSGSFHVPEGVSGILVPRSENTTIAACTFYDAKWPNAAPKDGRRIVRAVVGRAGRDPALDLGDDDLTARVHADVRGALGVAAEPSFSHVVRWERGLAQYAVGHLDRVARIERDLSSWPTVALPGSGYRGSGLPDCIRQGREAARRVLGALP